ncbi:hypothetical protein GGF46_001399 [Coemansia sp. RSA 552]|nr:hypothetical protein GGF46_001399 [Coemansia sp. RSA 552]
MVLYIPGNTVLPTDEGMRDPGSVSFIGIHGRENPTKILYVSKGAERVLGFPSDFILQEGGTGYIVDSFDKNEYTRIFERTTPEDDGADIYMVLVHLKNSAGDPVPIRITSFVCDTCVLCINVAYPTVPFCDVKELRALVVGSHPDQTMAPPGDGAVAGRREGRAATRPCDPLYRRCNRQAKAAFVVESPESISVEAVAAGTRAGGALIEFVTGSVGQVIDADASDLVGCPFLQLVAPEHMLRVAEFLDGLSGTNNVKTLRFLMLRQPCMGQGDILIRDEDNLRVAVECVAASSEDGAILFVRKLYEVDSISGREVVDRALWQYRTDSGMFSGIVSSDPDTSDAPGWSPHV